MANLQDVLVGGLVHNFKPNVIAYQVGQGEKNGKRDGQENSKVYRVIAKVPIGLGGFNNHQEYIQTNNDKQMDEEGRD